MADDDNDFIDLLKAPEKTQQGPRSNLGDSNARLDQSAAFDPELLASWNPGQRDYPNVLLITFGGLALLGIVIVNLIDHPGGWPVAALVIYTVLIPYILSDRFLSFVPWALLKRFGKKFLIVHCLALAVVYAITTLAFSAKPGLPGWLTTSGRRPALFYYCLGGILLALAFWECSWISQHKARAIPESEQPQ